MAHFAKINSSNIVDQVIVVDDENTENEAAGIAFLNKVLGDISPFYWKQTSKHTFQNKHYTGDGSTLSADQSKAFRGNGAHIGMTYESARDALYKVQPYASWTFNESIMDWEAPTARPDQDDAYLISWVEENTRWEANKRSEIEDDSVLPKPVYYWNGSAFVPV